MMVLTMISNRVRLAACLGWASAALVGCSPAGAPETDDAMAGSANATGATGGTTGSGGRAGSSGSTGGSHASGNGSGGTGSSAGFGSGGTAVVPGDVPTEALLPARVRRLTTAEYAATVRSLLGVSVPEGVSLPPDTRQDGFTRNESQRVDPVLVKQLDASAQSLAAAARARFGELAPCSDSAGNEACARSFIESFGQRAFRRPLGSEEVSDLVALYNLAAADGTYAEGIELTLRAMLQSPGLLYVTELGDGSGGARVQLTSHELANALSYLVTAGPPDGDLISAAEAGQLATAEGRATQAWRLLGTGDSARTAVLRQMREWLGLDRMLETGKDTTVYTDFKPEVRTAMDGETLAFLGSITFSDGQPRKAGTIAEVLGADWTMVDRNLAGYYGMTAPNGDGFQRVTYPDARRRGILNQGAFLSIYAHASESSPILRGVSVLKRLLCRPPQTPTEAGVDIPPSPQPDGQTTTRERYENLHGQAALCRGCHVNIDAVGFTFEAFDGAGHLRFEKGDKLFEFKKPLEEGGEPFGEVNSATTIDPDLPVSGDFANSAELALALSESPEVRACYARHLFRSVAAASGASVKLSEDAYIAAWRANPAAEPGSIMESLVTFVTSPLFAYRRAQ
jgi:hypothetical protein